MSNKNTVIELADVIEGLRAEMEKAQKQGEGKDIRFSVNNVEVELDLTVAKKLNIKAGAEIGMDTKEGFFKYLVGTFTGKLTIGTEGEYEAVSTQKIKLNLSAKDKKGKTTTLSGKRKP